MKFVKYCISSLEDNTNLHFQQQCLKVLFPLPPQWNVWSQFLIFLVLGESGISELF